MCFFAILCFMLPQFSTCVKDFFITIYYIVIDAFSPHGLLFSRWWTWASLVSSSSSCPSAYNALLMTPAAMTPVALITAYSELGLQDCRWAISFPRLKETTSSWRGTQDRAASLTSRTLCERLLNPLRNMPHLLRFMRPGIPGTGSSSASTR